MNTERRIVWTFVCCYSRNRKPYWKVTVKGCGTTKEFFIHNTSFLRSKVFIFQYLYIKTFLKNIPISMHSLVKYMKIINENLFIANFFIIYYLFVYWLLFKIIFTSLLSVVLPACIKVMYIWMRFKRWLLLIASNINY